MSTIRRYRIPREFDMPGGFHVIVRLVTWDGLQAFNEDSDEVDGLWHWDEDDGGTIYLVRGRDPFLRVKDFLHEMGHVFTDWKTWYERKHGGLG